MNYRRLDRQVAAYTHEPTCAVGLQEVETRTVASSIAYVAYTTVDGFDV
jgi:hypothetical protein